MTKMITREEMVAGIEDGWIGDMLKAETFISFGLFVMDEKEGLTKQQVKGPPNKPRVETVKVSDPFEVLGACRDPNGSEWGKLICFRDADGRVHFAHVTDAELHGDPATFCAKLAREGLSINRAHQRDLAEYLSSAKVPTRITHVERTGWHKIGKRLAFVLPEETIASSGLNERVILNSAAHGHYEANGALADWQAGVGALSENHGWARFAISVALSGPLAELVNAESGGFNFLGQTSIGKSSLLCAGASVWGKGSDKNGYIRSWSSTANGLEGAAASASDTCLILDELGVAEAHEVGPSIYRLANGVGKGRANRDGSSRTPASWRVLFLSSSEVSVDTKIEEDRGRKVRAGQIVRLLDIPANRGLGFGAFDSAGDFIDATGKPDPGKLADAFKEAASVAYGTAGPAFVRGLLNHDQAQLAALVKDRMAKFVEKVVPKGAAEQVGRAAKRFALAAVAGELATAFSITPWKQGDARQAAEEAFEAWLSKRGGAGSYEERQAVEQVRRMVTLHGESRFETVLDIPSNIGSDKVHNRLGWRKGEGAAREWWIPPVVWKSEFCEGLDPAFVAKTLAAKGMLRREEDGKHLQRKVVVGGGQRVRVYVLTSRVLDDGS